MYSGVARSSQSRQHSHDDIMKISLCDWSTNYKLDLLNKKLVISGDNHQKLGLSDNQFDFGTSPSMGSTD